MSQRVNKLSLQLRDLRNGREKEAERIKCKEIIEDMKVKAKREIISAAASFRRLLRQQAQGQDGVLKDMERSIIDNYKQQLESFITYDKGKRHALQEKLRTADAAKTEAISKAREELESMLGDAQAARARINVTKATISLQNKVLNERCDKLQKQ